MVSRHRRCSLHTEEGERETWYFTRIFVSPLKIATFPPWSGNEKTLLSRLNGIRNDSPLSLRLEEAYSMNNNPPTLSTSSYSCSLRPSSSSFWRVSLVVEDFKRRKSGGIGLIARRRRRRSRRRIFFLANLPLWIINLRGIIKISKLLEPIYGISNCFSSTNGNRWKNNIRTSIDHFFF